jgi:secreted trypsin-like serine protease
LILERLGHTSVIGVFSANEGDWQVFTRVSSYADWIEETMFREGTRPAK